MARVVSLVGFNTRAALFDSKVLTRGTCCSTSAV